MRFTCLKFGGFVVLVLALAAVTAELVVPTVNADQYTAIATLPTSHSPPTALAAAGTNPIIDQASIKTSSDSLMTAWESAITSNEVVVVHIAADSLMVMTMSTIRGSPVKNGIHQTGFVRALGAGRGNAPNVASTVSTAISMNTGLLAARASPYDDSNTANGGLSVDNNYPNPFN